MKSLLVLALFGLIVAVIIFWCLLEEIKSLRTQLREAFFEKERLQATINVLGQRSNLSYSASRYLQWKIESLKEDLQIAQAENTELLAQLNNTTQTNESY